MHYVGMDCHISTLDFAVVNEDGRLVEAHSVATSVNGFMEFVKKTEIVTKQQRLETVKRLLADSYPRWEELEQLKLSCERSG